MIFGALVTREGKNKSIKEIVTECLFLGLSQMNDQIHFLNFKVQFWGFLIICNLINQCPQIC